MDRRHCDTSGSVTCFAGPYAAKVADSESPARSALPTALQAGDLRSARLHRRMFAPAIARRGASLLFLNETAVRAGRFSDTPEPHPPQNTPVPFRPRNAALGAALSLSGMVLGGLLVGGLVGARWDCNPLAAVVGLFAGILAGFYNLARAMWTQE